MIDKSWIKEETTIEEIEKITIVELEGLDPALVVEKGDWWRRSIYASDPLFGVFKRQVQEDDKIHRWRSSFGDWSLGGASGFVIMRGGLPFYIYTNSPR
jgi:hypothetical protein